MKRYEDSAWQDSMRVLIDYNNMMSDTLGEHGIDKTELCSHQEVFEEAARRVEEKRGEMRWRELPSCQEKVVEKIEAVAKEVRENYDYFVVLGIGGSALGPIAVHQALRHLHYNDLPKEKRGGPKLYVEDNIDPERMAALLDVIDVNKTMFNVITKSGSTSETMSQFLIVTDLIRRICKEPLKNHIIATTDEHKGNLIKIAKAEGLTTFYVPDGVGGRFSELCPVGLLAAAVTGIDIRELLAGAKYMDRLCSEPDFRKNPAYMMGALSKLSMEKDCNISVLMPYADSLKYMADWYAQLWAESLGKRCDLNGKTVHAGQTPVKSLGVTDQHSQVQLYTEGPFDKIVTFVGVDRYRSDTPIPGGYYEEIPDVAFLGGHSMNELIQAEREATEYALLKSGHMSRRILLPEVNAFTIGELLYLFEMETAFTGELLNINTFNQPGVEEGKNAAYAMLGKPGYDEKRRELAAMPKRNEEYLLG